MLYINRERNIGSFAVSNMSSYSPLLVAYNAYKLMKGEELPTVQPTPSVDSKASPAVAATLIVLIVIIVFMMTQKKRLAKKSVSIKKRKETIVPANDNLRTNACIVSYISVSYRV